MKIPPLSLQVASDALLSQLKLITSLSPHLQMNMIGRSQSLAQSGQTEINEEERLSEDDL